jgi:glycerol uptake facilitator-like aquaporin
VQLVTRKQPIGETLVFIPAQVGGAIGGAILANAMFDLPAIQASANERVSNGTLIGEVIATAGLVALIGVLTNRDQGKFIPVAVSAWIGSAYFFTSSTSFANPAVTIGRAFTDTFAGISADSVLPFIAAQLVGAAVGLAITKGISRA